MAHQTEPLVLLPGFMSDMRIWGAQIEAMSAMHTLHLANWGAADSVEDMADAVLLTAPPRFALAGHSLGGMVAMEIFRRAPERVSRLALISTNCLSETPPAAAEREVRMVQAKAGRLAEALAGEIPERALADTPYRGDVAAFLRAMGVELGAETYLRQARALQRRPDQQRIMRQIKVPVLVCCGAEDGLHLPRRHEFMAGLVPRADLVVIEGAGHLPMIEASADLTATLERWMTRVPDTYLLRQR
ncbi:alpha/beta fold hydrolase [Oceaniglobus indicus]|uniref:alpha/beta fold hydrolase n=1 Tax=Oceaniglobus indicus TaxID=2047749 RepID=UPI000C1A6ADA|nr:alpha/beta hydrolase [Oceaniglobus indicus]